MNVNKTTNIIGVIILMLMIALIIVNSIRDYAVTATDIVFYIVLFVCGAAFLVVENKILQGLIVGAFRKIINFKFGK